MKIYSHSAIGYEGDLIYIEVDIRKGIPGIDIVGLPASEVKESRERVKTASKNSNFLFPQERILINLSPAGIKKIGTALDLPIAIAIMIEKLKKAEDFRENIKVLIVGELHLDGTLRPVRGVLSAINSAKKNNIEFCIVPEKNLKEALLIKDLNIWGVNNLRETLDLILKLNSNKIPPLKKIEIEESEEINFEYDFKNLKGQELTKRAIEIAVAGGHNIMLFGPPGSGKTLSIKCLPSILPNLTRDEIIETNNIWSLAGKLLEENIILKRPIRKPHHTASKEGIIGGGNNVLPGEVSLAHNGILFLDEALEFKKSILQALREPIEDKSITIVRAGAKSFSYPANFQLILALNPCPCGNLGKANKDCFCTQQEISNYWKKLGGAMLDRIDIRVPVKPINHKELLNSKPEGSKFIRERVLKAREKQKERYKNLNNIRKNADLKPEHIEEYCRLDHILREEFSFIVNKLSLSSRATHSILKVARTISDLNDDPYIERNALFEAVQHRRYGDNMDYDF